MLMLFTGVDCTRFSFPIIVMMCMCFRLLWGGVMCWWMHIGADCGGDMFSLAMQLARSQHCVFYTAIAFGP